MSKQIEKDLSKIAKALESLLRLKEEEVRGNAKRRIETAVTIDGTELAKSLSEKLGPVELCGDDRPFGEILAEVCCPECDKQHTVLYTYDATTELITFTCNHCKHLWVKPLKTFCEDRKINPHDILIKSTVLDGRSCPYCGYINQVYFYDDCKLDTIQYTCVNCKRRWTGPRE